MREIGGYFEMEAANGEEFHDTALALNSGRHCLEYILKKRKISKLYIPEFMCYTATAVCNKCRCSYEYYPIQKNFLPDLSCEPGNREYIYIVNYYGQLSNEILAGLAGKYKNVIIDNVQAFFQMPLEGIDTIYSCRKFFGVADGGYLYTALEYPETFERDLSYSRMSFVLGRYEQGANMFFEEASRNNNIFDSEPVKFMSRVTQNILKSVDYQKVIEKREQNFMTLHKYLGGVNELDIICPPGSFMYPLLIENGALLRKKLIGKKIYIPCFWPDVFEMAGSDSVARKYAENILPLPCDQRYGEAEMKYIAENITEISGALGKVKEDL